MRVFFLEFGAAFSPKNASRLRAGQPLGSSARPIPPTAAGVRRTEMRKLKICINEEECIGDNLCAAEAPGTFDMDVDKAVLLPEITDNEETILEASAACPVDAITVIDEQTGEKLVPTD